MTEKNGSKLLPADPVLMAQHILIKEYGRTCAMFLQQVHYWLTYDKLGTDYDGQHWIYNTYEEWAKELCLSERTIKRCVRTLRDKGIILVEKLAPKAFDKTNYYTINYEALGSQIGYEFDPQCHYRSGQGGTTNTLRTNNKSNKSKISKKDVPLEKVLERVSVETLSADDADDADDKKQSLLHVRDMFEAVVQEIAAEKRDFAPKLDKKIARCLGALRKKFPTLEEWRKYLRLIASSAYLMSEKFILRLKWLLKFATIDRILAGDLGVKLDCLKEKPKDIDVAEVEALKHIEDVNETDQAKDIRKQILKSIDPREYNGWFVNIKIDPGLQFHYPNDFIKYFVTTRFACVLESVLGFNELKGENG